MTESQIKQIPKLINEGKKIKEIAQKFNCHTRTIDYWISKLKKMGVPINLRKGHPSKKITI